MLENDVYVTLEELEPLLSEDGYLCYGHGTGRSGNSDEVVNSIFENGLRTKDNSLYFTAIGLSTPTTELKAQNKEWGLPEPSIESLKKYLNNWQHLDSKRIIIARLKEEYINIEGDRCDRNGEMFGAFYNEKSNPNGKVTYYLDPKFILGCYDAEKQMVRLNKNYERVLSEQTIQKLKENYKKALEKTKARLSEPILPFARNEGIKTEQPNYDIQLDNFDINDFDWEDDSLDDKTR